MRLTPVENSSESREKVGEGVGWLPGVWKLKWGQIRVLQLLTTACEAGPTVAERRAHCRSAVAARSRRR